MPPSGAAPLDSTARAQYLADGVETGSLDSYSRYDAAPPTKSTDLEEKEQTTE